MVATSRPLGEDVVIIPGRLVGAICPPVMPKTALFTKMT